ncbi:hypothetical protein DBR43_00740 [Pedobacter sp. KBW06]|uniref:hypothetical protein n=1 Tax=Pedobacter sp. KBW06 TaxID=2153359 RepID=UPI000F5A125F|nr:hypothetical protein [Pedobacter sp. KBW06]RQO73967.1 hypothetical protein DBR43_00740 [Pedobacter sp. KBW06]
MNSVINAMKMAIGSQEIIDLVKEYAEMGLDEFMEDDILKNIPLLNTIGAFYKFGNTLRERKIKLNVLRFLQQLEHIDLEERQAFLEKLNNEDQSGRIFEQLMLLLEKLDETVKAEMLGNLFRIYIVGKLSRHTFFRCCAIVERAYIADLILAYQRFYYIIGKQSIDQTIYNSLVDSSIQLSDLNYNLMNLGIISKDLKLLTLEFKMKHDLGEGELYGKSSLNYVGRAIVTYIIYDYNSERFRSYLNQAIVL